MAIAATWVLCALVHGPAADGAEAPIAHVTGATPLSGGDGWLVWSAPVAGGWALDGYHDGSERQLPVPVRAQPFDAAVGSSSSGAPVVTFSRCTRVPSMRTVGEGEGSGGPLVLPATGRGCRVVVLDLDDGRTSTPQIPAPRGASDTSPSMWRGTVTFARHDPAHGSVWQVLTWSPLHPDRIRTLPHGRIPSCPERSGGCRQHEQGTIGALSSDGAVVTFLWELPMGEEGIVGEGAWEVRVDRADGSRSALAAGGFGHEACFGPPEGPHELEYIWPEPPIAAGGTALIPEMYAFSCFDSFASVLGSHGASAGHGQIGKLDGVVAMALARDEGHLYALVPQRSPGVTGGDNPVCSTAAPCAIEQVAAPVLRRDPQAPFVPFQ